MLFGREPQMALLGDTLREVAGGTGRVVAIVGEAGIGKTHLVSALAELGRARGLDVAVGRCFAEGAVDLGPWLEALGARVLGPDASEPRAELFERALAILRERSDARGLVVVLEDLHWADAATLELFLHAARFALGGSLLLCGTVRAPDLDSRGEVLSRVLAELARDARSVRIELRPLDLDEVLAFASAIAGADVPQAIARALHAESGGNPLYVRELVRHLLEEGKVVASAGRLATDRATAALGLPATLRLLVLERAARLSEPAGALARCAALASSPVALTPLAAAADVAAPLDALDEALASGLLLAVPGGYAPSHAIVGRALRESESPDRAALRHRRLAEALAAVGAAPAEIAAQYFASRGLPGAAAGAEHALRAAGEARRVGSAEGAIEHLGVAASLLAADGVEGPRPVDVWRRLALARAEGLDVEGALAALDEAARLGGHPAELTGALVDAIVALERRGAPRAVLEGPIARAEARLGDRRELAWARLSMVARPPIPVIAGPVWISRFAGTDPEAVALLRASGSERDYAASVDPHANRSREETEALLSRARGWSDPRAALPVLDACARDLFFACDLERAENVMEELRALAVRAGSPSARAACEVLLGCVRAARTDLVGAREAHARALALTGRLGAMHRMAIVGPLALDVLIGYYAGLDGSRSAATLVELAGSPRAGQTPFGIVALGLGILGSAIAGDADTVRRLVPHHLRALEALPIELNEWGAGRDCGATAVFELGLVEHAPSYLALCQREPERAGSAAWACVEESRARLRAMTGDLDGARDDWAQARERFAQTGRVGSIAIADHDEALTLVRAGRGDDPAVEDALTRARVAFEKHGMTRWIASTQRIEAVRGAPPAPDGLTRREVEVLALLAAGLANKEIGAKLFISVATVERHVANVYAKIGARGRAAATAYALKHGLTM